MTDEDAAPDGLPAALVAALAALSDVPKERQGVHGKYADLAAVHGVARPVLGAHGLGVVQDVTVEDGWVSVVTEIVHVSGESRLFGPIRLVAGPNNQSAGSSITYARRYGLMAALGMAGDDDDGGQQQQGSSTSVPGRSVLPPAGGPPRDAERSPSPPPVQQSPPGEETGEPPFRLAVAAWRARLAALPVDTPVVVEAQAVFAQHNYKTMSSLTFRQADRILGGLAALEGRVERAELEAQAEAEADEFEEAP